MRNVSLDMILNNLYMNAPHFPPAVEVSSLRLGA
jgi:hypothetical protein